jgi:lipoic acid synthetase
MNCTFEKKHISLGQLSSIKKLLRDGDLNTVCESALCPNIGECFNRGTATFLIMGNVCTRRCSFCAVNKGVPSRVDSGEPDRVAQAVKRLGLKYAVITSVTRDDLKDGGAKHFYDTVMAVKNACPETRVEVLTPDFSGDMDSARTVFGSIPFVFNHNLETVPSLYSRVRPEADYRRSLSLLGSAKRHGLTTKSGLMLGLGETEAEVRSVMKDLRAQGCDILTLGQYLAPSKSHFPVAEFLEEPKFKKYAEIAEESGFIKCFSAPYVRSSYFADDIIGITKDN